MRKFPNGEINGKQFQEDGLIDSYIHTRINTKDIGSDKAEVFLTACLREFPFPEYQNEKFLGEDIVWLRMARKYKMVHLNRAIYIGNYLDSGLTKNRRVHNIKAPIGCMNRGAEFLDADIIIKYRVRGAVQYLVYGYFAGMKFCKLFHNTKHKCLVLFCSVPARILYLIWSKKYIS